LISHDPSVKLKDLEDALLYALSGIVYGYRSVVASKLTQLYFTNPLELVQFLIDQRNQKVVNELSKKYNVEHYVITYN